MRVMLRIEAMGPNLDYLICVISPIDFNGIINMSATNKIWSLTEASKFCIW